MSKQRKKAVEDREVLEFMEYMGIDKSEADDWLDEEPLNVLARRLCLEGLAKLLEEAKACGNNDREFEITQAIEYMEEYAPDDGEIAGQIAWLSWKDHKSKIARQKGGLKTNEENIQFKEYLEEWYRHEHHRFRSVRAAALAATKVVKLKFRAAYDHLRKAK